MPIDINSASAEELAAAAGIEQELAEEIIDYRDEVGSFDSLDEVAEVPGGDEALVMQLREAGIILGAVAEGEDSVDL